MNAQRRGSDLLVMARLRAYDAALAAGKTADEARGIARTVERKHITGVRTDETNAIVARAVAAVIN